MNLFATQFTKRKKPLDWTPYQYNSKHGYWFRTRIVGYIYPSNEDMSHPIYEAEERIQIVDVEDGNRKILSRFERYYFYKSYFGSIYNCLVCMWKTYSCSSRCPSCGCEDRNKLFTIVFDLPEWLGFNDNVECRNKQCIPHELKEELMQATWNPDRPNLWEWTLDLEERREIDM